MANAVITHFTELCGFLQLKSVCTILSCAVQKQSQSITPIPKKDIKGGQTSLLHQKNPKLSIKNFQDNCKISFYHFIHSSWSKRLAMNGKSSSNPKTELDLVSTLMARYDGNTNYFANAFSIKVSPKGQKKNPDVVKSKCKSKNIISVRARNEKWILVSFFLSPVRRKCPSEFSCCLRKADAGKHFLFHNCKYKAWNLIFHQHEISPCGPRAISDQTLQDNRKWFH